MLETNLAAAIYLSQACLHALLRSAPSDIVIMSSIAGLEGFAEGTVYCAAKAGLVGFSRALAAELKPANIRVTAICPGSVDTEFFEPLSADARPAADADDRGRRGRAHVRPDVASPTCCTARSCCGRGDSEAPMSPILLVDDTGLFRGAAEEVLKRTGCETLEAAGGTEALDLVRRGTPGPDRRQCRHEGDDGRRSHAGSQGGPRLRPDAHRGGRTDGVRGGVHACRGGRHIAAAARPGGLLRGPAPVPAGPAARGGACRGRVVDHVLAGRPPARRHDPGPFARRLLRTHRRAAADRSAARSLFRRSGRARRAHRSSPRLSSSGSGRSPTGALGCRFFQLSAASKGHLEDCLRILALGGAPAPS